MYYVRLPMFLALGMRKFTQSGYESASKNFSENSEPSLLKDKTVMITGANQGIGLSAAKLIAKRGCTVYMVCRNPARGAEAVAAVKEFTGNPNVHLIVCDVSSMSDVRKMASEYVKSGKPLHVLVNNAGVMIKPPAKSSDGIEINFATNTLGSYAVTRALEPALKRSAPAKVIFVSSGGALLEGLETEDFEGKSIQSSSKFHEIQYSRDKRRQIALAEGFSREWKEAGIAAYSMHPGWVDTEAVKTSIPDFYSRFKASLRTPEQGADTIAWLAEVPTSQLEPGGYYLDRRPQSKHLPLSFTGYSEDDVLGMMMKLDHLFKTPSTSSNL
jgi:dehydrogenase/reductase SDR family protein 12